jgi:hypothetical protein
MTVGTLLLCLLALYALSGVCVAIAFVSSGVSRVLPQPMGFTLGARLLLIPGAAALWPYVLARWLKARSRPRSRP